MAGSPNEDPEGSRITYVKGDLFACPKTDSLAHCISEDCRMGAGIAVLFKKKFGGVQELLNQQKKSGEVAVLKRDGRYIYYLWPWKECGCLVMVLSDLEQPTHYQSDVDSTLNGDMP
ncbi:ADP-ribose glycohydrolase OARD1 isoform X1 [Prionailurus iriomotensis]